MKLKPLHWFLIIFIISVIMYQVLGSRIGMFSFMVLFQCAFFYLIMADVITYYRSRKGPFVTGKIENIREIEGSENPSSYEVEISFIAPGSNEPTFIKQRFDDLLQDKELIIWVNESNLQKSVAVCKYDIYWALKTIFFTLIIIGMFIPGYLILTRS